MPITVRPKALQASALALASLLVLGGAGVSYVSYEAADRIVHPPREQPDATPAGRGLAYEEASFLTGDGLRLAGWWMPADAEALGTVVFLHGYGASKAQSLAVAPFLHEAGFNVLAFDFRAHGDSEGAFTTIGLDEGEDLRAAVAFARERGGREAPLALFGWSMGAAAALMAARDLPEVRALVLDSSFARLQNVVAHNLESFTGLPSFPFTPLILLFATHMTHRDVRENDPARAAGELERPMLVIQGLDDTIARWDSDALALKRAAGEDAELWLVPGASHVNARRDAPTEYEARVLAFLRSHLTGAEAGAASVPP